MIYSRLVASCRPSLELNPFSQHAFCLSVHDKQRAVYILYLAAEFKCDIAQQFLILNKSVIILTFPNYFL